MRRGLLALCRFAHIYIHRLRADIDTDSLSVSIFIIRRQPVDAEDLLRDRCIFACINYKEEEGAGKRKRAADIDQITAAGKGKTFFIFVISFHAPGSGKRQNKTKQKKTKNQGEIP